MNEIKQLIGRLLGGRGFPGTELRELAVTLDRVVAEDVLSRLDLPFYDESLRDGYALHKGYVVGSDGSGCFAIKGEIAAGQQVLNNLQNQQVIKIMTGAEVPENCDRVIPRESGSVSAGKVRFTAEAIENRNDFIKRKGSEVKKGALVVPRGVVLSPAHLARLAEVGIEKLVVYRRPKICFFCTGKELVDSVEHLKKGKKISSNRYLLSSLIQKFGGEWHDCGIIEDDFLSLKRLLESLDLSEYDMVVSTGGTGPGKYDLVEKAFRAVGGDVFCTSLNMRPGKSVVMGKIEGAVFCGLPGPPSAAEALFHEIVGPVMLKLQGVGGKWPETVQAYLDHDISVKSWNVVHLKGGIISILDGTCRVRKAQPQEFSTCNIVLQPDQEVIRAGALVEIHLKTSPFGK